MPAWIRCAAPLLIAFLTATVAAYSPRGQSAELFDRYAQSGDTGPLTFRDVNEFVALLASSGRDWVRASPAADRQRRRDLLALLALETATSAPGHLDGLRIIEWACEFLREGAQTDFERQWMSASASLFLRSYYEFHYVYGPEGYQGRGPSAIDHLDHALSRFPREPRLRLAKILLRPEAYALSSRPGGDPDDLVKVPLFRSRRGPPGLKQIARTAEALGALINDPEVGAEAQAHLGWLQFHVGDLSASRSTFALAAAASKDAFVRNLAWLGLGLSLDADGRRVDATEAYRAAVEAMPRARASAIQLAAHLHLAGERREAAALVESAYGPDPLDLEPWRHVLAFDRLVAGDVRRLRGSVGLPEPDEPQRSAEAPSRSSAPTVQTPTELRRTGSFGQGASTLRARAEAVVLSVLVESDRVPFEGLKATDFDVTDNGERQVIEVEQVDTIPIDVSLVIDFFNETSVSTGRGVELATPGVSRRTMQDVMDVSDLLAATDRLRVLQVDGNVAAELWTFQPPPFPRDRLPERPFSNLPNRPDYARAEATYGRMQTLYDVVAAALLRESPPDRRHLVILFTDGVDGASVIPAELLLDVARESGAVMYVARRDTQLEVAARAGNMRAMPYISLLWPPDPSVVETGALHTGGSVYYRPLGSLLSAFKEIIDRFRRSYVLRYRPTNSAAGWHEIMIRIRRPGQFDVKTRKGYTVW